MSEGSTHRWRERLRKPFSRTPTPPKPDVHVPATSNPSVASDAQNQVAAKIESNFVGQTEPENGGSLDTSVANLSIGTVSEKTSQNKTTSSGRSDQTLTVPQAAEIASSSSGPARNAQYWVQRLEGSVFEALTRDDISLANIKASLNELRSYLQPEWPSMLLNVKSMTSFTGRVIDGEEAHIYNEHSDPEFAILSYKWGTWKLDGTETLQIKGIGWPVPSIDPKFWTVAELEVVLRHMAETESVEWVWLDVACADQAPSKPHLLISEVIREPQIYAKAKKAYVWLVDVASTDLRTSLNELHEHVERFAAELDSEPDKSQEAQYVMKYLLVVLQCEWFRSPWTLRETLFCEDAIILDRQAQPVTLDDGRLGHATISTIIEVCRLLLLWLKTQIDLSSPEKMATQAKPDDTIDMCLDLVNKNGPFFLLACNPRMLNKITRELLQVGYTIDEDGNKIVPASSGWGHDYRLECRCVCTCDEAGRSIPKRRCVPCVLGVSFDWTGTLIDSKTTWMEVGTI